MKKKVIEHFGNGDLMHCARVLEISPQRIRQWHDDMTITEKDGVIAKAIRKNAKMPENQRMKRISTVIPDWLLK
jgi:hypothetical protein